MKYLFAAALTALFSFKAFSQAKAEGCIDSALRAKYALKMKAMLSSHMEKIQKDVAPEKVCGMIDQESKDLFDSDRESSRKVKKHLVKQFAHKKKIPGDVFVALHTDSTKKELTEADVCEETTKVVKNSVSSGPCDSDKFTLAQASRINTLNGSFDELCQQLIPVFRDSYKRVQRCGANQAEEKKGKAKNSPAANLEIIDSKAAGSKKTARPARPKVLAPSASGTGKTGSSASGQ